MTPDQEQTLVSKVEAIHDALVGPLGIKENGIIHQVSDHGRRLTALERWRWILVGGLAVIVFALKLWAGSK